MYLPGQQALVPYNDVARHHEAKSVLLLHQDICPDAEIMKFQQISRREYKVITIWIPTTLLALFYARRH